jgi:hypothetical protein
MRGLDHVVRVSTLGRLAEKPDDHRTNARNFVEIARDVAHDPVAELVVTDLQSSATKCLS